MLRQLLGQTIREQRDKIKMPTAIKLTVLGSGTGLGANAISSRMARLGGSPAGADSVKLSVTV